MPREFSNGTNFRVKLCKNEAEQITGAGKICWSVQRNGRVRKGLRRGAPSDQRRSSLRAMCAMCLGRSCSVLGPLRSKLRWRRDRRGMRHEDIEDIDE